MNAAAIESINSLYQQLNKPHLVIFLASGCASLASTLSSWLVTHLSTLRFFLVERLLLLSFSCDDESLRSLASSSLLYPSTHGTFVCLFLFAFLAAETPSSIYSVGGFNDGIRYAYGYNQKQMNTNVLFPFTYREQQQHLSGSAAHFCPSFRWPAAFSILRFL